MQMIFKSLYEDQMNSLCTVAQKTFGNTATCVHNFSLAHLMNLDCIKCDEVNIHLSPCHKCITTEYGMNIAYK